MQSFWAIFSLRVLVAGSFLRLGLRLGVKGFWARFEDNDKHRGGGSKKGGCSDYWGF